ncbi:MAG: GNAT family N-acetyltransferase [Breznakibacter sp.]
MDITKINRVNKSEWQAKLKDFKYSFFISPEWIESAQNEKCRPVYLDFVIQNQVKAKIAGLEINGGALLGKQLYFYSGPAMAVYDDDTHRQCYGMLLDYARTCGYSKLSVRPFDQRIHHKADVVGYKVIRSEELKLYFAPNEEIKKFSFGFKQNVKKARKAGVEFHESQSEELFDKLFELIGVTQKVRTGKYGVEYNPLGLLNLNENTLRNLIRTGGAKFYYATLEGKVVSIQLNIEFDNRTYGFLMGSDTGAYKIGAPSFLDANIIQQVHSKLYHDYNLGGAPSGEEGGQGIIRYKESMGAERYATYGYYSPFFGIRYYWLTPLHWVIRCVTSFWLVRKLQAYALRKGWIG